MPEPVQHELIVPKEMTPEFLQAMADMMHKTGTQLPPPSGPPLAPTFSMEMGWRKLGIEVGSALRSQNIFLKGDDLGRVNVRTGIFEPFDEHNFCGWSEEFCRFTYEGDIKPLPPTVARTLMKQFTFREQIRPLEGIHLMTLPVMRKTGEVEWLPPGYDAESRIYTVETLKYEMDWGLERGRDFIRGWCQDYPWMRADSESPDSPLEMNRSYSAHVAAMVGAYCRAMVPPGALRPMVFYVSNQSGSGKSTCAHMALIPVFGYVPANDLPRDDGELNKELAAAAQDYLPFLFLDDVGGMISSTKLNRFILAPVHGGRILGLPKRFQAPNVTQVFATGNHVTGSADIARRALVVEMFYAGDVKTRKFPRPINPFLLAATEVRMGFLSALCSLVKHWAAQPLDRRVPSSLEPMGSFEEWSKLIASIVMHAVYANPLSAPLTPFDSGEDEMKLLLIAAADSRSTMEDYDFTREEMIELGKERELLEEVIGGKGRETDNKANIRFGKLLRKWKGRELVDTAGRRFRFGKGRDNKGATYPIKFLDAPATGGSGGSASAPTGTPKAGSEPGSEEWEAEIEAMERERGEARQAELGGIGDEADSAGGPILD